MTDAEYSAFQDRIIASRNVVELDALLPELRRLPQPERQELGEMMAVHRTYLVLKKP